MVQGQQSLVQVLCVATGMQMCNCPRLANQSWNEPRLFSIAFQAVQTSAVLVAIAICGMVRHVMYFKLIFRKVFVKAAGKEGIPVVP